MSKLFLLAVYMVGITPTVLAQLRTCPSPWQTTKIDGTADTIGDQGTVCKPVTGAPAGTCAGTATTEGDAVCYYSIFLGGYRCCYQLIQVTFATPGPGSTLATLGPGTTPTPRNSKPKCPNGALSTIIAFTNQPVSCNMTNGRNQGCPNGYSCVKATNVMDVYGTTDTSDDLGASMTPNICCKTSTLTSYKNVFIEVGLTPTLVPSAPSAGIDYITLGDAVPHTVGLSDDLSMIPSVLALRPLKVKFLSNLQIKDVLRYHALWFDATNNKDCIFRVNIELVAADLAPDPKTLINIFNLMPAADFTAASVYNAGPAASPVYTYSAAYQPPIFNTSPHRYVLLIWATSNKVTVTAAGVNSPTGFNLNPGLYGDLEPGRASGNAGLFTTVSALIAGKITNILGQPIAGTYFYVKT